MAPLGFTVLLVLLTQLSAGAGLSDRVETAMLHFALLGSFPLSPRVAAIRLRGHLDTGHERLSHAARAPAVFEKQAWTYSDVNKPPAWLIPADNALTPGLPLTRPPPVPAMVAPPSPIPFPESWRTRQPPAPLYALADAPPEPAHEFVPVHEFVPDRA